MRFVVLILLGLMLVESAHAEISATPIHGYLSMLLDHDAGKSRLGARSIGQDELTDIEVTDALAEVFVQSLDREQVPAWEDCIAWYAKALGMLRNPRYREILQWGNANFHNHTIQREIVDALGKLPRKNVEPYIAGSYDLRAMQLQLDALQRTHVRLPEQRDFSAIKQKMTLEELYQRMGLPDAIDDLGIRVGWGMYWGTAAALSLHYYGQGIVVLDYRRRWVVSAPMPAVTDIRKLYSGERIEYAHELLALRGQAFFSLLRSQRKYLPRDYEMLDILSVRLKLPVNSDDKFERKGMQYALSVLAASRQPKYLDALKAIATTQPDAKLAHVAQKYADSMSARLAARASVGATGIGNDPAADDVEEAEDVEDATSADADKESPSSTQ